MTRSVSSPRCKNRQQRLAEFDANAQQLLQRMGPGHLQRLQAVEVQQQVVEEKLRRYITDLEAKLKQMEGQHSAAINPLFSSNVCQNDVDVGDISPDPVASVAQP